MLDPKAHTSHQVGLTFHLLDVLGSSIECPLDFRAILEAILLVSKCTRQSNENCLDIVNAMYSNYLQYK